MNPPEFALRDLIYNNYDIADPAKANVLFPKVVSREFLRSPHSVGKKVIYVYEGDSPHRPATFTHRRVDLTCIVYIYIRADSGVEADVEATRAREQSMIEEVCDIIIANGPLSSISDFHPSLKHKINRDEITLNPPIFAHEIHVQCTYLR